jgi:AcrR family transcriptional regulator
LPEPAIPSSRDKILDTAEALFARRGFAGVGLREVAERAQLSKSALFHHFPGKVQLYLEVLQRVLARLEERLERALRVGRGAAEKLDLWVDALVDGLAEQPTTARLLLRGLFEDDDFPPETAPELEPAEQTLLRIIARFQQLVREGREQGVFRDVSVAHTTQTVIGATVYHFASGELGEAVMGGPLFSAQAVHQRKCELQQFLRNGLTPRPS